MGREARRISEASPVIDFLAAVPPQNLEAEASVLGAILLDRDAGALVVSALRPEQFYKSANRTIYAAMVRLLDAGSPVDVTTLHDALTASGTLDAVGGRDALRLLVEAVPSAAAVEYYAGLVRAKADLREIGMAAAESYRDAWTSTDPAEVVADRAEARLMVAIERRGDEAASPMSALILEETNRLDSPDGPPGISTGLEDMDAKGCTLKPAELTIIAGRPGHGKTSLALTIVRNAAGRNHPALLESLEMTKAQVTLNLVAQVAGVDTQSLSQKRLTVDQRERVEEAWRGLYSLPIFVDAPPRLSIGGLRSKARLAKSRHGLALLVVDYLQLMDGERRKGDDNRVNELASISRGLKQLSRELFIPVVALASLNRGVESREGRRPRMSDLRECGAIESDADNVWLVFREAAYKPDDQNLRGKAEVIVDKHRGGSLGTVPLRFDDWCVRFAGSGRAM